MVVSGAVAQEPSIRSARQFLAGQKIAIKAKALRGGPKRSKHAPALAPKTVNAFCEHNMLQCMATSARDLGDVRRAPLAPHAPQHSGRRRTQVSAASRRRMHQALVVICLWHGSLG